MSWDMRVKIGYGATCIVLACAFSLAVFRDFVPAGIIGAVGVAALLAAARRRG
jgi:hypothetical protein